MFLTDQGYLLRKAESGERHILLAFFLRDNGLKYALARKSQKTASALLMPDLFERGDLTIEQKDPARPAFLTEFMPLERFPEVARHYRTFTEASRLARFFERNLLHMENFDAAWDLLGSALHSLSRKGKPEATLLKVLFLFARNEGYPINAHWLANKDRTSRDAITAILKQPVAACTVEARDISLWVQDLMLFFARETDLLPPEGGNPPA